MKNFRMDGGWANIPEPAKRVSFQQVCAAEANTWVSRIREDEGVRISYH